jgi:hypothetical protein
MNNRMLAQESKAMKGRAGGLGLTQTRLKKIGRTAPPSPSRSKIVRYMVEKRFFGLLVLVGNGTRTA